MPTLQVQVIPEVPAPKRSFLRQIQIEKERKHTENAEYHGDKESAHGYEIIEENDSWYVLCEEISRILENRGIDVDADYISDFLAAEHEALESAQDAKKANQAKANEEDFNLHLAKLSELQAALIILHIKYYYSFGRIGSLMNLSDQHADNLYRIAEDAFDSDDIQNVFFSNHAIHFGTSENDLTGILIHSARAQKSRAGRPTKTQTRKNQINLAARVSNGGFLDLGV